jgi:signal peptidase I
VDVDKRAPKKRGALREGAVLVGTAVLLYYVMLTFVARPYLIPSESMEPTLHGCKGCVGDRIMVDKITYRLGAPEPGDVVVFKASPEKYEQLAVNPMGDGLTNSSLAVSDGQLLLRTHKHLWCIGK